MHDQQLIMMVKLAELSLRLFSSVVWQTCLYFVWLKCNYICASCDNIIWFYVPDLIDVCSIAWLIKSDWWFDKRLKGPKSSVIYNTGISCFYKRNLCLITLRWLVGVFSCHNQWQGLTEKVCQGLQVSRPSSAGYQGWSLHTGAISTSNASFFITFWGTSFQSVIQLDWCFLVCDYCCFERLEDVCNAPQWGLRV